MAYLEIDIGGVTFAVNENKTRAASEVPFGIALYVVTDKSHFRHSGLVDESEQAIKWLNGEDVTRVIVWE
jgi:hypothetical protein